MHLQFFLPLRTVSALNVREHWAVRSRRTRQHRTAARLALGRLVRGTPKSAVVRLIRCGVRLLDDDNVRGALKAVRDGIADALGIDDGDTRVRYEYEQRKVKRAETGVLVVISGE